MRFPSTFLILSALISANLGAEPWNLDELSNAPGFRWDDDQSQIRSLFYEGLPYQGKETEVFAFYGSPKTLGEDQDGPFPAVVLVHGGGGTAFAEWVNLWAKRGYAAIAMEAALRHPSSIPKPARLPPTMGVPAGSASKTAAPTSRTRRNSKLRVERSKTIGLTMRFRT